MPRLSDLTGVLFSRLMRYAQRKGFIDRESYIAQYIALALFTVGVTNSLGNDDLLAAFAAGVFPLAMLCFPAHPCMQVVRFLGMAISTNRPKTIHFPQSSILSSTAPALSISERGFRSTNFISLSLV